jgi:hypothetical protein
MSEQQNSIPKWMQENNQAKLEAAAMATAAAERKSTVMAAFAADGLEFWKRFVAQAGVNAEALPSLIGEQLAGSMTVGGSSHEHRCSIQVDRRSLDPDLSVMHLYYKPGTNFIRCWYMDQELPHLRLEFTDEGIKGYLSERLLDPEEFADAVVTWMVRQLKGRRRS